MSSTEYWTFVTKGANPLMTPTMDTCRERKEHKQTELAKQVALRPNPIEIKRQFKTVSPICSSKYRNQFLDVVLNDTQKKKHG